MWSQDCTSLCSCYTIKVSHCKVSPLRSNHFHFLCVEIKVEWFTAAQQSIKGVCNEAKWKQVKKKKNQLSFTVDGGSKTAGDGHANVSHEWMNPRDKVKIRTSHRWPETFSDLSRSREQLGLNIRYQFGCCCGVSYWVTLSRHMSDMNMCKCQLFLMC